MCGCRKGSAAVVASASNGLRVTAPLIYGEDDTELPVLRAKIFQAPEGASVPSGATRWVRGTGIDDAVAAGDIEVVI